MLTEQWLPVSGHEGYEVSDLGRVRSVDRWVNAPQCGGKRLVKGRVLKQTLNQAEGYLQVHLGAGNCVRVYRLVAEAFLGPRPENQDICHGPNGKMDSGVSNLSYGTRKQNAADRKRDGTNVEGSRHYKAKLTEATAAECLVRHANGEETKALATEFGVDRSTIRFLVTGQTWKHVQRAHSNRTPEAR